MAVVVAMLVTLSSAVRVSAQDTNAQVFVEQARAAFDAGDYRSAAELFDQAAAYDNHPIIRYNQARCYEELGDLPRALGLFRDARALHPSASIDEELAAKEAEIEAVIHDRGFRTTDLPSEELETVGSLSITSIPSGAVVELDEVTLGPTPIETLYIAAGEHRVRISNPGYRAHNRTIDIEPNRTVQVHAGLRPDEAPDDYVPPEPGRLELGAPRRDMDVYLDEDFLGRTPIQNTAVPPGRYRLQIRHPDFETWSQDVEFVSGETLSVLAEPDYLGPEYDPGFTANDWGLVTAGLGGAALVTGIVFGVLAKADADRYNRNPDAPNRDEIRDTAQSEALVADVMYGTAAGLGVLSMVLIFVVKPPSPDDDELVFDVGPTYDGWVFGLGGTF